MFGAAKKIHTFYLGLGARLVVFLLFFLVTSHAVAASPDKPVELRAVTAWEKGIIFSKMFYEFVNRVNERAKGALRVRVVGGPEAIPPFEQMSPLRRGVVDLVNTTGAYYAGELPEALAQFLTPGSMKKAREVGFWELYDQVHRQKLDVRVLGAPGSGTSYNLYTNFRMEKADLTGRKMRTTASYTPLLRALGASLVTMAPAELYTALERGVVDGTAWPSLGVVERRFHEVLKYKIEPGFYAQRTLLLMSEASWNRLSPQLQRLVMDTMLEIEQDGERVYQKQEAEEFEQLKAKGMEFIKLPPQEAKKFLDIASDAAWRDLILPKSPDFGPKFRDFAAKVAGR